MGEEHLAVDAPAVVAPDEYEEIGVARAAPVWAFGSNSSGASSHASAGKALSGAGHVSSHLRYQIHSGVV